MNHEVLLKSWIADGWRYRSSYNINIQKNTVQYKDRLHYEYNVIYNLGFTNYFLIVADLVRWAKDNGIAVGPGRGSSASSLIAYFLRITEIDPVIYPMLFDRFISPDRKDPPDIDVDMDDSRRDEIYEYARNKYGADRVANIGTFTRYRGRNSIDDVARVYHVPQFMCDAIKSKLIERPEGHPRFFKTLEDTYNSFSDIAALVKQRPELTYAAKLEGNVRNFGVHAAGLVISSRPLSEVCAIYARGSGELPAIAFDKYDAAYLGLLKIDILGLSTMGMIAEVCRLAGIELEDLYRLPLDDEEVLAAFRAGDVLGVFQFEGITTRRTLKAVAPTTFMHLSDVNALSRPGADDKQYVINKNKGKLPVFIHPIIEQHLNWTYGVVVYEEQILMILRDLGGFEPAELNRMRKIIHDKLGSTVFNEYYERFIKGAATHGLSESTAKSIWDGMVSASGYAFNIAHSVSYSHIGYWSQWLKIHYPSEFYTGQLLKCSDDVRRAKLIGEAMRHGIKVEVPNLTDSQENWSFDGNRIIAGLTVIPGIGLKTAKAIIDWRDAWNTYNTGSIDESWRVFDWEDLMEVRGIGEKTIQNIVDFCKAPDPFGAFKTSQILDNVRSAIASGKFPGIPTPTHASVDIPLDGKQVVFCGIVRKRKYYDAAEQLCKRTVGLEYEQALKKLDDSHLLKYAALYCEDEYGEQVVIRVSRWKYGQFARMIESIKIDSDVVVAQGKSSDFQGISINTYRLVVLEP